MDKNYFVELTIGLYQATDVFPDEEPLKFLLRKKADQLLEELAPHHFSQNETLNLGEAMNIERKIQSLQSLLKVAEARKDTDSLTIFLLNEEYEKVKEELTGINPKRELGGEREEKEESFSEEEEKKTSFLNKRQREIISLLRQEPNLKTNEIAQKFPGVTHRTIRRDLEDLGQQKFLRRKREGNNVLYQVFPVDKS